MTPQENPTEDQKSDPIQPAQPAIEPPTSPTSSHVVKTPVNPHRPESNSPVLEPIEASKTPVGVAALLVIALVLFVGGAVLGISKLKDRQIDLNSALKDLGNALEEADSGEQKDTEEEYYQAPYEPSTYADQSRMTDAELVVLSIEDFMADNNGKAPTTEQLDLYVKETYPTYYEGKYNIVHTTPYLGEIQYAINTRCLKDGGLNYGASSREASVRVLLSDNKTYYCTEN